MKASKKLLIVEDDPVLSHIYEFKFRDAGYEVDLAGDGQLALDKVRDNPPDIVLLDLSLPKLNGLEVLRRLRAQPQWAALPIVVFANGFLRELVEQAKAAGANECLIKEKCSPEFVSEVVRGILNPRPARLPPLPAKRTAPIIAFPRGGELLEAMRETETDLRAQQRQTFLTTSASTLAELRAGLTVWTPERKLPPRQFRLQLDKLHILIGQATALGLHQTAFFISAVESLLQEVAEAPEAAGPAVRPSVVETLELLDRLFQQTDPAVDQSSLLPRLLVVEDDPVSLKLVAASARGVGLQCREAPDALQALQALQLEPFDAVLLDIDMPNLDGLQLLDRLRALPAHGRTPVLFVTGLPDTEVRVRSAVRSGADVIFKPFRPAELAVKSLRAILRCYLPPVGEAGTVVPVMPAQQHARVEAFSRRHRTGLLALLFTDIVGSTELKRTLGDREGIALIQRHHALVRKLLATFSEAEEIETAGDSFLIVFAKPSEAVRFALLLQAEIQALARAAPHPIADRVGIHVGEVMIAEGADAAKPKALFGIQVDTCARVMSLAGAQQILMTRFAFDSARQVLREREMEGLGQLRWVSHGPYLFKGLEEPLEICEVRLGPGGAVAPPPSTEKARRHAGPGEEPVLGWRPAAGQPVPGTQWHLESKLGEGGFGEVWLGHHQDLKEQRVFKFCFRADRARALKREMTLFRVLKERVGEHPHLVRLLEVNLEQPPYYLVEEYVPGRDLRTWCDAQGGVASLSPELKLEIVAQAAEGLQAAHEAGIIHRDVKPGNILIADLRLAIGDLKKTAWSEALLADESDSSGASAAASAQQSQIKNQQSKILVKVTDFGIGQVLSAEFLAGITATGLTGTMVVDPSSSRTGTQMYMAPELIAGQPASIRSDLYALGVVLYQLAVGDFLRPVTTDWARDMSDPCLREDLQHCFAGRPEERFNSARQLADNLRALPTRRAGLTPAPSPREEPGLPRVASVAVLPFASLSVEPENELLSDGIAEDLITALARVPGLQVSARTSAFAFKGKTQDIRFIGQQLSVQTVLEGSVRRAGTRLRITAQLINVADGFHLWSERYDRELQDVFAIQDEITQAILTGLKTQLSLGRTSVARGELGG